MSQRKSTSSRIIDIAQRVGVSKGTVACVLNNVGKGVIRVGEAKRAAILQAAKEMNYVPNIMARALAGKSGMKIGILIDSKAPRCTSRILWSIEDAAADAGYRLMIGQAHNDPQSLFDCYDNFVRHGIDGVICLAHEYPKHREEVRSYFRDKKNLVFHDPPEWGDAPHVKIDRESGMIQAILHLQETGRNRIGLWLPNDSDCYSYRQRISAYRKSCIGEEFIAKEIPLDAYVDEVLRKKLTGVIAANDTMAARLARELMCRGVRIPADVALIGHDNDDFSEFYCPSLTTIDQNDELAGRKFFELLMKQLKEETVLESVVIETKLIIRESSSGNMEVSK